MLRAQWLALLMAPAVALWGCGDPTSPPPPPPTPTVSAISPSSAIAGSPDLTLTITGANFTGAGVFCKCSNAVWAASGDTTLLATTFVSSTQLTAVVPAALLSSPVTAQVLLETGDLTGDSPLSKSNARAFRVEALQISSTSISAISPTDAVAGSPDLTLTITGAKFAGASDNRSQVAWAAKGDTTLLATTFVSSTQLTAVIPAALLSNPVTARVFVETGDPMGDLTLSKSNAVGFTVASPPPAGTGTIIVYGRTSTVPPIAKGYREVALDKGAFQTLLEGDTLIYSPVVAGDHRLVISNPCTGTHQPLIVGVTLAAGETFTLPVSIPPNCE